MALAEEISQLENAMRLEKAAPDILPYDTPLVSVIVELIEIQQEALNQPVQNAHEKFQITLFQLDLDRVKFLLSSYLKTRLFKIQEYIHYIVNNDLGELLSEQEVEFAEKYYLLKTNHFKKRFLVDLPKDVSSLDDGPNQLSHITEPNKDKYVFAKVLTEIGRVQITPESSVLMTIGDVHLVPYDVAKPLVEGKVVQLL